MMVPSQTGSGRQGRYKGIRWIISTGSRRCAWTTVGTGYCIPDTVRRAARQRSRFLPQDAIPAEREMARYREMGGEQTGEILPQCAGTAVVDEQRIIWRTSESNQKETPPIVYMHLRRGSLSILFIFAAIFVTFSTLNFEKRDVFLEDTVL